MLGRQRLFREGLHKMRLKSTLHLLQHYIASLHTCYTQLTPNADSVEHQQTQENEQVTGKDTREIKIPASRSPRLWFPAAIAAEHLQ